MNRADRLVARREKDAAQAAAAKDSANASQLRRERTQAWQGVHGAIPPALASLERRGWPGATTIKVEREGFFGYKKHSRAARRVCSYSQPLKDVQVEAIVYLTSDGDLALRVMGTPIALRGKDLESVLSGMGPLGELPIGAVVEGLQAIADGA